MTNEQAYKIISQIDVGWIVVAVAVPTRGLRVICNDAGLVFRVEQLDITQNFKWRPVSTHTGDKPWESLGPAIHDLVQKQTRLKEKIKYAQHEQRMAMIKAEAPLGQTA